MSIEWVIIVAGLVGLGIATMQTIQGMGTRAAQLPEKIWRGIPYDSDITDYGYRRNGEGPFDGWVPDCNGCSNPTLDYIENGYKGLDNPNGDYAIDLRGEEGKEGTRKISQDFQLDPTKTYRVEFDAANVTDNKQMGVRIEVDGNRYGNITPSGKQMTTYHSESFSPAGANSTISLGSIKANYAAEGIFVSNIRVVEVTDS